jgi:hypothetical protein
MDQPYPGKDFGNERVQIAHLNCKNRRLTKFYIFVLMVDILFCAFYILLFSVLIGRSPAFSLPGLNNRVTLLAFYLKLIFGLLLWFIYAHHYKNRITSDIFKYYDDSKVIFSAIHDHFGDYIKLVFGIDDGNPAIHKYFLQMNSWLNGHESTLYNNSHFIIRLNAIFMLFSGGHYGVHVILMCFLSLWGLCLIYKAFYPYLQSQPYGLFAAVFLFPSVLLWGSGILKEGLVLLGLGLTIYYGRLMLNKPVNKKKCAILFIVGLILLFENKAYVLLCILPCFIAEFLIYFISVAKKHPLTTYMLVTVLYLGAGFNLGKINPKYDPLIMISYKQQEFNRLSKGGIYLRPKEDSSLFVYLPVSDTASLIPYNKFADSLYRKEGLQYITSASFTNWEIINHNGAYFKIKKGAPYLRFTIHHKDSINLTGNDSTLYWVDIYDEPANSRVEIAPIKPTIVGLIAGVPQALNISVIRPHIHEAHSAALLIYLGENHVILLFILLALVFFKRNNPNKNKIAFCLVYCLLMLTLIGLTTPIYGGIERYKVVVIPFLLILLLMIYDKEKVKRLFKKSST